MISVSNLSKTYKDTTVLAIESLELKSGEIIGLVGNNGAGKTTFFSLLLDLIKPTTGYIENTGVRVDQSEDWKQSTAAFIDDTFLIGYLTPEEYFSFIAGLRNVAKGDLDLFLERFKTFFNDEVLEQKKYIRDFSKGNQKKVGIAAAFIGAPQLVILDEPFANLDPRAQMQLQRLLRELNTELGCSVFVSSHDLLHVSELCQRILILNKGTLVKDARREEISLEGLRAFFAEEIAEPQDEALAIQDESAPKTDSENW
ncbi:MAG: ABC transporter ATP-binding protein [Bacteroidetes bacterium]|nr:ABC transporter ATP-binding protein [Bacteroidota bacterium]